MYKKYVEAPFVVSVNVDVKEKKEEDKIMEKSIPNNNCKTENVYKFIRISPDKGFCVRKEDVKLLEGFDVLEAKIFRVLRPLYGPVSASKMVKHLNSDQKSEYQAMFENMVFELMEQKALEGFKYVEPLRSPKHLIGSVEDDKPFKVAKYNNHIETLRDEIATMRNTINNVTSKLIEDLKSMKGRLKSIERQTSGSFKNSADIYTMVEQLRNELDNNSMEDLIAILQEFINWKKRQERGTECCKSHQCDCHKK